MNSWQENRVHAYPATIADDDILSRQMFFDIQGVVITRDDADIRCDVSPFPDVDVGIEALEINAEALEIVQIIRVKMDVTRLCYDYAGRNWPRYGPVEPENPLP